MPNGRSNNRSRDVGTSVVVGAQNEKGGRHFQARSSTGPHLDPGYVNTGSCQSSITFLDGEKILRYRGYPIEQLAEEQFLEVSYLLIYGSLPSLKEFDHFVYEIKHHDDLKI